MSEMLVIVTNCRSREHRPLRESLHYGGEYVCDRCSRNGFFFHYDYRKVDYDTWEAVDADG
jgi:hypothetical protein